MRGYWLAVGVSIEFESGATVLYDYNGDNALVLRDFSPFNTSANIKIENLRLIVQYPGKCRYLLHDDWGTQADGATNEFKNIIFDGKPAQSSVVGGGCGWNNTYIFDNVVFLNDGLSTYDIAYHNVASGVDAQSKIIVKNCSGNSRCYFNWMGESTKVTDCIVNNSKFLDIKAQANSSGVTTNENMRLISYCNTIG